MCLVPIVAPSLTPEVMSVEVEVNSSLALMVQIDGFNLEVSTVTWTRNTVLLSSGLDGITITNTNLDAPPGISVLMLDGITTPAMHGGVYVATATNPAGSDMSTFTVTVTGKYTWKSK